MTHECDMGQGIWADGDGSFAPRVLEIGKVHGSGMADESMAYSDNRSSIKELPCSRRERKRRCEIKAERMREKTEKERERETVAYTEFVYIHTYADDLTF